MKNKKELLKVEMLDGSVFEMPNDAWQQAFDIKYGNNETETIKEFKKITKKHFDSKTIPTKYDWDEPAEYKTHAETGRQVMYIYIRAALMAVIFEKFTKGKEPIKVIGIGEDGITEYTGKGKKELKKK